MDKKIADMEREELWAYMKASHDARHFNEELPSWQRAIELYKKQTGMKFDPDCTGCRRMLIEWLTK